MKRAVSTREAPGAIGPYSQGIRQGAWLFSAGQVGLDPGTGDLVAGGASEQAERALQNLGAVLRAAGLGPEHVVKTTVFLTDMADFADVNKVYGRFFTEPFPARSTVQVAALPKGASVEIDLVACGER
jgi:2-iminobutanoate/2-iminopropanoate deaminase